MPCVPKKAKQDLHPLLDIALLGGDLNKNGPDGIGKSKEEKRKKKIRRSLLT